jgi:hypothetical protein
MWGRLAVFVAIALLTRAVLVRIEIVDVDEAAYLTGAWELLRGRRLYVDFADHKPPLVFFYYALAQLLGRGMFSVRLLTDLVTVPLTALGASAFFRHDRRGLVAGLLLLVYGSAFLGHDVLAVNCELLMMLPLAWALVQVRGPDEAARWWRAIAAGGLVGIAALFKYQAAPWIVPVWLATGTAAPRRRLERVLLAAAAAAVPPLAAWAGSAAVGAGGEFLYWNVGHNLAYVGHAPSAAEAAARAATYALPFLLVTAPLWWLAVRSARTLASDTQPASMLDRSQRLLLASATLVALATTLLGGRFYPHYFIPLYLPLALAAAPAAESLLRAPLVFAGRALLVASLLLWAGFSAANAYLYLWRDDVYVETRPVFAAVASRLRQDACFGSGSLFVWGFAPGFYARTGLPVASRFVFVSSSLVGYVSGRGVGADPGAIQPRHWQLLMEDLERSQPAYVLDTSDARLNHWSAPLAHYPELARFVAASYVPLDRIDGVTIYRRRDCGPGRAR